MSIAISGINQKRCIVIKIAAIKLGEAARWRGEAIG